MKPAGGTRKIPKRVVVLVQARLQSQRFPGKVLKKIGGLTAIEHIHARVSAAHFVDGLVFAIPHTPADKALKSFLLEKEFEFFEGPESDVLDRYGQAAEASRADTIVRVTGDCPLVDPLVIDEAIERFMVRPMDYLRTSEKWPDGLDVEVFSNEALQRARREATLGTDREHVTRFFRESGSFSCDEFDPDPALPPVRLTLDYTEDLEVLERFIGLMQAGKPLGAELNRVYKEFPEVFNPNAKYSRNEGASMGAGEKLYARAKKVIPGGTMLLSKRPEMHSPSSWPSYFERAQGCQIWDLDGEEYLDVGWMGVGTNILGYANPQVDDAVRRVIDKGNLSTLNAAEEVYLAEKLCELHPWAEMVRFTRSGGEAGAVAVRIARAAAGKSHIAFCGYHGWHDWYLSANLSSDDALDGHLLPGLNPLGVPPELKGTSTPFEYNNLDSLKEVLSSHNSGVIYMEVERSTSPKPGFLEGVRKLADEYGAVLVFDECTSGFRSVLGGEHLKHEVLPDIAVFGKTLGNGYAINAIIGTQAVMDHAQQTFISSTFWTERIGVTAGLASLKEMDTTNAPQVVHNKGNKLRESLLGIAESHGLSMTIAGLPALTTFTIAGATPTELRTLITSELLKKKMLGANAIYLSLAHDDDVIARYLVEIDRILSDHREHFLNGSIAEVLTDGTIQQGFARLA